MNIMKLLTTYILKFLEHGHFTARTKNKNLHYLTKISTLRTVKVGVPKKVVFTKISGHVSVSYKSIS
jgi:hypothetical protein